ncbi:hypothetical protein BDU57DRAFT_404582, partial [Ampelomyces quisqualis]
DAAPFGPAEGSNLAPAHHLNTGSAIGVALGVVSFLLLLIGIGVWLWRRRGNEPINESIEAPAVNRNRSASSATDQKTLVASLPNSPQQAGFHQQHEQMHNASFAPFFDSDKVVGHNRNEKESFEYEGQNSHDTKKPLPLPPNNMPLPPPPTEGRYAINVNINKSMIFDDMMFNMASRGGGTPRDSGTSRDRTPRYRFEEYLPPVTKTPSTSTHQKPMKQTSAIEMKSYPGKSISSRIETIPEREDDTGTRLRRKKELKKLEIKPPQLPIPELLPPPSPYDWYQDIIGTEQTNVEDTISGSTPAIPDRSPARTPIRVSFGAVSTSPPNVRSSLVPPPLSPAGASHLHPNMATVASPTSPNFRLSPTVYTMPSQPPTAQPLYVSQRSTMTPKTHASRSWLPDDGLYLPKEGSLDSYTMFKRQWDEDSRPTSYTPL